MDAMHDNWPEIATAIAALSALIVSIFSIFYARESLLLSKAQDFRKNPKLTGKFLQGLYTKDEISGGRIYRFEFSVSNQSDSDNTLVSAELRLRYRLQDGTEMTARLRQMSGEEQLRLPMRIVAHETVAGWCHFQVPSAIVAGNMIDQYLVELTDTHEQIDSVSPLILSERVS